MDIMPRLIFVVLSFVGIIILQIFLSRKESKWLGLILPIINVAYSIIAVLSMIFYIGEETMIQFLIRSLMVLFMYNIPTIILLAVYFACREKSKKIKEIEKMNIQDL